MSAFAFVVWLAWWIIAAFLAVSARDLAHRWLDQRVRSEKSEESLVIPDDLTALSMGETEKWAQDSVLSTIREKWDQYRDWNKVRAALGVASRD